ncbi:MAG: hypothetical protein IPN17_33035 [Deltaproteobacteria bacterium]|nr:hypothetical protein [Deltaproteobacteria bacterium]
MAPRSELLAPVVAGSVGALLGHTFQVAAITAVANLVPRARRIEANGRMHGSDAGMFFVGPMLVTRCATATAPPPPSPSTAPRTVSAASLTFVRARFEASGERERVGLAQGLRRRVRFLWSVPTLRAVTVLLGLSSLLACRPGNLLIFHVKRTSTMTTARWATSSRSPPRAVLGAGHPVDARPAGLRRLLARRGRAHGGSPCATAPRAASRWWRASPWLSPSERPCAASTP